MRFGRSSIVLLTLFAGATAAADEGVFRGLVSSATPEATAAGVAVLEAGGNAIDAAVAVSLTLAVTEPAGSGIGGQTVMLVKRSGEPAFVIHGTTWSPGTLPDDVTEEQLKVGRTASTVPSTLRVLDVAHRRYGSGKLEWAALVQPAIDVAERGFIIGPFRERAFRFYGDSLKTDPTARAVFFRDDGTTYRKGDRLAQPLLAETLRRIAAVGAMDFYRGEIAERIAADMAANGGWITLRDLEAFPEPGIVPAIRGRYRGFEVETLPPPFGGWVVLQILNILEESSPGELGSDDSGRRLILLDALRIAHGNRRDDPVTDYTDYGKLVERKTSREEARRLLATYRESGSGETTHFSVVDGDGTVVAVTQSIDSYFGSKVAHPTLGFLYNNYMQGFQVESAEKPYYIEEKEMPLSSMSATIVSTNGEPQLVLGSPGSARIISSVAPSRAYVEGPELPTELLTGMGKRGLTLARPAYGVSDGHLDPYFGGIHALARENGRWIGVADPRRDGEVAAAGAAKENRSEPDKVLFVGNSFTFYNDGLPNHYRKLVTSAGAEVRTRMSAISGAYLREHIPGLPAIAASEDWDVIVFQGYSRGPIREDSAQSFRDAAKKAAEIARDKGAEPVLFMTWAYKGRPEMTALLDAAYSDTGDAIGAQVVPVGRAFARAVEERPQLALRTDDLKHPTLAGTYLAACVFYAALNKNSPEGIAYTAGLDPDDAAFLQRIAWETVATKAPE